MTGGDARSRESQRVHRTHINQGDPEHQVQLGRRRADTPATGGRHRPNDQQNAEFARRSAGPFAPPGRSDRTVGQRHEDQPLGAAR